ncbi:hypothetical protein [Clostridium sp. BL-8]|uniref:hypothetical protein n=1 Tax=Clostridium sp. BL-8 TaxID=349938 RepID=UPI00098BCF3D|nr:hypothetical protein [Clostridium sp. BL-8]OOM71447.1 hypothetical protein CLOBL_49490 [Clostridium sp. BL-8]
MEIYEQLKDKSVSEIDYIELEYQELATTLVNSKSYKVNLDTKQLEVVYYSKYELNAIELQNQETEALNNRVSDISSYLSNSDETTILNIENSILEIEKNKIINGGI